MYRARCSIPQYFNSPGRGQAKDPIAKEIALRPPPTEKPAQRNCQLLGRAGEHHDSAVGAWQPILSEEVLVMGHEQKTPGTLMDLRVASVIPEPRFILGLAHLAKTRHACQALGYLRLDVVIQKDEWRLRRLPGLPRRQRLRSLKHA